MVDILDRHDPRQFGVGGRFSRFAAPLTRMWLRINSCALSPLRGARARAAPATTAAARWRGSAMDVTMTRRSLLSTTMTAGLAMAFTRPARAQSSYPDKPIKIILPYTAGSPND